MMNYYRANFPREPYTSGPFVDLPRIQMPVLQFHGMNDTALLPDSLNDTWEELDQDWTLVTVPGAGHWPHHDKPDVVSNMMRAWLTAARRVDSATGLKGQSWTETSQTKVSDQISRRQTRDVRKHNLARKRSL
jgi:poly(3-hydroxyalkanoate) synthetase